MNTCSLALIATCLSSLSWAYTPVVADLTTEIDLSESDGEALLFDGISVTNVDDDSNDVNVEAVVTITDPDWGNDALASASATSVVAGDEANEVKPAVTFSAMTPSAMATALATVKMTNSQDRPAVRDRSVQLVVTTTDESGESATSVVTVSIVPVNDEPTLDIDGTSNVFTEGGDPIKILTGTTASITDPDDINMTKLKVEIENFCDADTDVLELAEDSDVYGDFTTTWVATTDGCTFEAVPAAESGLALIADWETLLGDLYFYSQNETVVVETARWFSFALSDAYSQGDGDLDSDDTETAPVEASANGVVVTLTNTNDAPVIVIPDGADDRSTTELTIAENAADDVNLAAGSSGDKLELLIYDVDSGLGDFTVELTTVGDEPTADVLTSASLDKSAEYAVYDSESNQLSTDHWGADRFEFLTKTTAATASATDRTRSQYFDFENIDPATGLVGWKDSYDADTNTFALRVTAEDGDGASSSAVMYFKLTNVDEAPQPIEPSTGSTVDREGIATEVYGMVSPRKEYRQAVDDEYVVQTVSVVKSFVQVDEATHALYGGDSTDTLEVTYKKADMIHGQHNRIKFNMDSVSVDPEGGTVTYALEWKGYQATKAESTVTDVGETVDATGVNVDLDDSSDDPNYIFDELSPLKWTCEGSICELSGTPSYDTPYKLDAVHGSRTSPAAKTLHFELTATDDDDTTTVIKFQVDIEIAGCMDVRASYVTCAGGSFEDNDCTNFLTQTASGTNLATFVDGGFVATDASKYTEALAPANSAGRFNEEATVPKPTCAFAPRRMATGAGTQQVGGSAVAASSSAAATLVDGAADAAALEEVLNSLRGTTFLDVDTDLLDGATTFSLEQIDASDSVIIPEGYDGIASAAVKVGPAGLVVGTNDDGVPGFKTTVFPGAFDTSAFFCAPLHATLKDSTKPELGYKAPEPCEQIEVADGGACVCFHSSNSIIIPALRALPQADFLPSRYYQSGGGCPAECSGHGFCRAHGKCACFAGWGGYDCASRTCPYADAWAADDTISRRPLECSGRGSCDRGSGTCGCFDGFEGPACERLSCPSGCSGHGKCRYINELPDVTGYSEWDAERIQACVCDGGYFGADCSLRTCPRGDDPQTLCDAGQNHKQEVTVTLPRTTSGSVSLESGSGAIALRFTGSDGTVYRLPRIDDVVSTGAYSASAVKSRIESAFKSLPSFAVDDVTVTPPAAFDPATDTDFEFTVEFTGVNTPGDQALLACDVACPLPGCRPKHNQLRLSDLTGITAVEPSSGLEITAPSGAAGVQFAVTFTANANLASGYSFEVVRSALAADGTASSPASLITAPVPLNGKEITVANGFRFKIDSTAIAGAGTETLQFYPATCSVAVTQRAGQSFESAECSNRGLCDRSSGLCDCFEGYAGSACSDEIVSV